MAFRKLVTNFHDKDHEAKWQELNRRIANGFGPNGEAWWDNVLFVGKDGDDGTAVRGSFAHKYLTIQAAIDAAQNGDAVLIGPGVYTESVVVPEMSDLSIIGISGEASTIIDGTDGSALRYVAVAEDAPRNWIIAGISFRNAADNSATVLIDGTNATEPFVDDEILFRNCVFHNDAQAGPRNSMELVQLYYAVIDNCRFVTVPLIEDCETVVVKNISAAAGVDVALDGDAGGIVAGRGYYLFRNCDLWSLNATGQPEVQLDNCSATSNLTATFTESLGKLTGLVLAHACRFGGVVVSQDVDTPGTYSVMQMDNCSIGDGSVLSLISAGDIEVYGHARSCDLASAVVVRADDSHLDIRGSAFVQSTLEALADGTIDRDVHSFGQQVIAAAGTALVYTAPFPPSAAGALSPAVAVKDFAVDPVQPAEARVVSVDDTQIVLKGYLSGVATDVDGWVHVHRWGDPQV